MADADHRQNPNIVLINIPSHGLFHRHI